VGERVLQLDWKERVDGKLAQRATLSEIFSHRVSKPAQGYKGKYAARKVTQHGA